MSKSVVERNQGLTMLYCVKHFWLMVDNRELSPRTPKLNSAAERRIDCMMAILMRTSKSYRSDARISAGQMNCGCEEGHT